MTENENGEAVFDFSLTTAFWVTEKISEKYFVPGFGTNATQKHPKTNQEKVSTTQKNLKALKDKPETTQKELAKLIEISIDGIKYHIPKMTKEGSLNTKARLKQVNGLFSWSKYVEIGETLYQLGDTKSTLLRTLIINKKNKQKVNQNLYRTLH